MEGYVCDGATSSGSVSVAPSTNNRPTTIRPLTAAYQATSNLNQVCVYVCVCVCVGGWVGG